MTKDPPVSTHLANDMTRDERLRTRRDRRGTRVDCQFDVRRTAVQACNRMIRPTVLFHCCRSDEGYAKYTDRDGGRSQRSKFAVAITFVLLRFVAFAQVPPDDMAKRHLLQAQSAIEDQDYSRARIGMERFLELQAQRDLKVPTLFYLRYARVLDHSGSPEIALENVKRFLDEAECDCTTCSSAHELRNRLEWETSGRRQAESIGLPEIISAIEFVRIPAGQIRINPIVLEPDYDEKTQMDVHRIKAFDLGKYEVTQEQWTAAMGYNPSSSLCGRCPVTGVSWNEIQEFIGILNQAAGEVETYRLPTNAEWDYAARDGWAAHPFRRDHYDSEIYPDTTDMIDFLDSIAWYQYNTQRHHRVGEKAPNVFGLYDMIGNVWEWVEDRSLEDPPDRRLARGCGVWNGLSRCILNKKWFSPSDRDFDVGYRLARTVQ